MAKKTDESNNELIKTEKDWFLQTLVDTVNNNDITIGITVITHGFLVSGNLVGGKEYFKGFGQDFASGDDTSDSIKAVGNKFEKIGEDIYSKEKQKKDGSPTYIHFKNAKFFHPNGQPIPNNKGIWWRGRLTEIGGFSLGTLSAESN